MHIISRTEIGLRPPGRPLQHIERQPGIVVHCTGGKAPRSTSEAWGIWKAVQRYHQTQKGWSDIGYSLGVTAAGLVLEGRGFHRRGAHTKGLNDWLGVAVFGDGKDITEREKQALQAIYRVHLSQHGGRIVIPHCRVARKTCPGPAVTRWVLETFPQE